jgi:hypothetical protein
MNLTFNIGSSSMCLPTPLYNAIVDNLDVSNIVSGALYMCYLQLCRLKRNEVVGHGFLEKRA